MAFVSQQEQSGICAGGIGSMATLTRSQDHSIWFKHIDDSTGELLTRLRELVAGQSVVLQLGDSTGVWVRFNSGANGKVPEALKCGDENSKQIWHNIPLDGSQIEITLVEVLTPVSVPLVQPTLASSTAFSMEAIPVKTEGAVLCIGVDVAWWGGQTGSGKKSSRTETIAYVSRDNGEWSQLSLKRVDLNSSYKPNADPFTPNADADAHLLTQGIKEVLASHPRIKNIVLAVDMPILALDDGMPRPRKANERGGEGGQYRACDLAWMRMRERSAKGWSRVNIFAGAPIVPRVRALVEKLRELAFEVYGRCASEHQRVVIECFPNEVAWSAGVLGFAEGLTINSLQLYKRLGKHRTPLPQDLFDGVWKHPIDLAFRTALVDCNCRSRWLGDVRQWLAADGVFDKNTLIGKTGKQFDDVIDSVLSLSAAVAYAMGTAHIHQGTDPEDGHIIGPGITVSERQPLKPQ
jgi:hypothetical protein